MWKLVFLRTCTFISVWEEWYYAFYFPAVILCNFEEDFCDWTNVIDKPDWGFERKTAEELAEESRPGPDVGLNGVKNDHFLIAGNLEDSQEGSVAAMQSPYFQSKEHPVECFWFWFYFSVSWFFVRENKEGVTKTIKSARWLASHRS